MKVQITNEGDHYRIYAEGATIPLKNMRINFIDQFSFDEEDICNLIGFKEFHSSFQNGKYQYNISKSLLQLITGERSAQTREELLMYES